MCLCYPWISQNVTVPGHYQLGFIICPVEEAPIHPAKPEVEAMERIFLLRVTSLLPLGSFVLSFFSMGWVKSSSCSSFFSFFLLSSLSLSFLPSLPQLPSQPFFLFLNLFSPSPFPSLHLSSFATFPHAAILIWECARS